MNLSRERQGMSIPEIFAKHGEEYFRNLETNLLIELQNKQVGRLFPAAAVLQCVVRMLAEMKKNGYVVLSDSCVQRPILERVKENDDRPLLKEIIRMWNISHNLMEKRREKYETAADLIVIQTDKKNVQEICKEN